MEEIDGVVNVLPVPSAVPPVAAAYQLIMLPAVVEALSVTVPVPHTDAAAPGVAFAGIVFTVATTATRPDDKQPVVVFLVCA